MLILTPKANIKFNGRSETSDEVVVKEQFIENVYRLKADYLKDTGVVLDIGANIGAFSLFANELIPGQEVELLGGAKEVIKKGFVYAYEPEEKNFALLKQNINTNGASASIKAIKKAVGGSNRKTLLSAKEGDSFIDDRLTIGEKVEVITLEQCFLDNSIPYADVLKIDIEGAEYELFEGVPDGFLDKVNYICLEFHATTAERFGALISKLTVTHKVETLGAYDKGGQIYAIKY